MFTEIATITNAISTAVSWAWNEATPQQILLIVVAIGVFESIYRGCQEMIDHNLVPLIFNCKEG